MSALLAFPHRAQRVDDRLAAMIDLHFHPQHGSEYWLHRAASWSFDPRTLRSVDDLARVGLMSPEELRAAPLRHFVPRALRRQWHRMIVGQTGGTTGPGAWTCYLPNEFHEAFIAPFECAARHTNFPRGGDWLYIGPSGPHIIGKVVRPIAHSVDSADPFSVDFDPRWAKKLPSDSMAFDRYLEHVVQQAVDVLNAQTISVLFTTPAVMTRLAHAMTDAQRAAIRGVHYGGMALSAVQLAEFQNDLFPNAVHLSGYGNTLFGCCMECSTAPRRSLEYFPYGDRLLFEVIDQAGQPLPPDSTGQVCFSRLDESFLILRMRERDRATLISPPKDAPSAFHGHGVRDPHSPISLEPNQRPGLY